MFGWEQKNLRSYFFGRYVEDLNVGIVHQNLLYDTMHKLFAFHSSIKKFQMRAAKMDPLLSLSMRWASLKSYETRNKAEEQTNLTSYQALSGHFFRKSLYTYKKLRNKVVPYMEP